MISWQSSQRGRKIGIFGNLSLGYIMHTQDSKGVISVEFYRKLDNQQEVIYIFKILAYGQGFEKFSGYIFIYDTGKIYQMTDERINEIAGEK
jgi:hypothetical protein